MQATMKTFASSFFNHFSFNRNRKKKDILGMSPRLFQDFMNGYIRLSPLAVEHIVVVMTAGSNQDDPKLKWVANFAKFVFRISGSMKF